MPNGASVRIDADRAFVALTDGREDGDLVSGAELHLEHAEPAGRRGGGPLRHERRLGEADGERGRRRLGRREAEEHAQGQARGLRSAVVREDVDRAACRPPVGEPLAKPRLERREIERIGRQERQRVADRALERRGVLAEERIGHAFAAGHPVALPQLHEHDALCGVRRARDREGDREVQLDRADARVHQRASRSARARRSAPAGPSRTGSAAGRPVSDAAFATARAAARSSSAAVLRAIATTGTRGDPAGRDQSAASS